MEWPAYLPIVGGGGVTKLLICHFHRSVILQKSTTGMFPYNFYWFFYLFTCLLILDYSLYFI